MLFQWPRVFMSGVDKIILKRRKTLVTCVSFLWVWYGHSRSIYYYYFFEHIFLIIISPRDSNLSVTVITHHGRVGSGEQWWRSGESTRLPPMWPGFDSRTQRHMWVEFVVGSHRCSERFFSAFSSFFPSTKKKFPNSNSDTFERFPRALWCFVGK